MKMMLSYTRTDGHTQTFIVNDILMILIILGPSGPGAVSASHRLLEIIFSFLIYIIYRGRQAGCLGLSRHDVRLLH